MAEDIYNMYYVYEHYKKTDGTIFYVGIGKNTINKTKYSRASSFMKRNPHWRAIVNKHGFEYRVVFESESRDEVCQKEIELISLYGRRDLEAGPLVNMTSGGEKTFKMSKESADRIIDTKRKNGAMEKMRESARKRMLTDNPWKGKNHDGFNNRRIYEYNADTGEFIRSWESIRKAIRFHKCNPKTISWVLSGKRKSGLGFIWTYEYMDGPIIKKWSNGSSKHIIEVDESGNILNEWESISKASKEFSCSSHMFSYYLNKGSRIDNRIVRIKGDVQE